MFSELKDVALIEFELGKINWDAIAAVSALLIAVMGFLINRRLRRQQKIAEKYALLGEYRREIITFSKELFEAIAKGILLNRQSKEDDVSARELDDLATKLSSLADTGRFLFPNYIPATNPVGIEKGPAFAGIRRPPIDAILAAHYAVRAIAKSGDSRQKFIDFSVKELRKTGQPLAEPNKFSNPEYLLVQSRRCYLNAVLPDTFPREWKSMFSDLLGPIQKRTEEN
jgi:hypothetical protein